MKGSTVATMVFLKACTPILFLVTVGTNAYPADTAWYYHKLVFGGGLVFDFIVILVVLAVWGSLLLKHARSNRN
jgi:hypothetical protein